MKDEMKHPYLSQSKWKSNDFTSRRKPKWKVEEDELWKSIKQLCHVDTNYSVTLCVEEGPDKNFGPKRQQKKGS